MNFSELFDSLARFKDHAFPLSDIDNAFKESDSDKFLLLDIFPKTIVDSNKYEQMNIFFQKYLDKTISKKIFLKEEEKFIRLITYLWAYNSTYAIVNLHTPLGQNYPAKRSKKELLCYKRSKIDKSELFPVKSPELLKSLISIGTREIGMVYFFFDEDRIAIELSGLVGLLWCDDEQQKQNFIQLASSCQLFTRYPDLGNQGNR